MLMRMSIDGFWLWKLKLVCSHMWSKSRSCEARDWLHNADFSWLLLMMMTWWIWWFHYRSGPWHGVSQSGLLLMLHYFSELLAWRLMWYVIPNSYWPKFLQQVSGLTTICPLDCVSWLVFWNLAWWHIFDHMPVATGGGYAVPNSNLVNAPATGKVFFGFALCCKPRACIQWLTPMWFYTF